MNKLNKYSGRNNEKVICPKCRNNNFSVRFVLEIIKVERIQRTCLMCGWTYYELPLDYDAENCE